MVDNDLQDPQQLLDVKDIDKPQIINLNGDDANVPNDDELPNIINDELPNVADNELPYFINDEVPNEPDNEVPDDYENRNSCAACWNRSPIKVILPCFHFGLCTFCANIIENGVQRCPFCRSNITSLQTVSF